MLGKQTCTGPAIAAGGTCTVNVRFAPRKLGGRLATLVVANDAGPDLSVGLGGNGVAPADASNLRSATSCESVRLTWRAPDAAGFSSMVLVRNSKRYPRNPEDGVQVKHRAGRVNDTAPAPVPHVPLRAVRDVPLLQPQPQLQRRRACASRCTWGGSASPATAE